MRTDTEDTLTFQLTGLSVDEIDALLVLLHRHSARVDDGVHRDVGAAMHTVQVFLGQHADAIAGAVAGSLTTALLEWLREWRKQRAARNAAQDAARQPEITIVRPDQATLRLRDASDEDVRRILSGR